METLTAVETAFIVLQLSIAVYGILGGLVLMISGIKDGAKKIGAALTSTLGLFLISSGIYALLLFYTNLITIL